MTRQRTLFVGIGSRHGDDQIGWLVADDLRDSLPADVDVRQASTPSDLLDWLGGVERLIVCDACQILDGDRVSGKVVSPLSRINRREWPSPLVTTLRSTGSHAFGLPQVLLLAQRLRILPDRVVIYGIAGTAFDAFAEVSSDVQACLPEVVALIARELFDGTPGIVTESVSHA